MLEFAAYVRCRTDRRRAMSLFYRRVYGREWRLAVGLQRKSDMYESSGAAPGHDAQVQPAGRAAWRQMAIQVLAQQRRDSPTRPPRTTPNSRASSLRRRGVQVRIVKAVE
jgi:hypothetical protein